MKVIVKEEGRKGKKENDEEGKGEGKENDDDVGNKGKSKRRRENKKTGMKR